METDKSAIVQNESEHGYKNDAQDPDKTKSETAENKVEHDYENQHVNDYDDDYDFVDFRVVREEVVIKEKGKRGKIVIEQYSRDDRLFWTTLLLNFKKCVGGKKKFYLLSGLVLAITLVAVVVLFTVGLPTSRNETSSADLPQNTINRTGNCNDTATATRDSVSTERTSAAPNVRPQNSSTPPPKRTVSSKVIRADSYFNLTKIGEGISRELEQRELDKDYLVLVQFLLVKKDEKVIRNLLQNGGFVIASKSSHLRILGTLSYVTSISIYYFLIRTWR